MPAEMSSVFLFLFQLQNKTLNTIRLRDQNYLCAVLVSTTVQLICPAKRIEKHLPGSSYVTPQASRTELQKLTKKPK